MKSETTLEENLCFSCKNYPLNIENKIEMVQITMPAGSEKSGCDICAAIKKFSVLSSGDSLSVLPVHPSPESPNPLAAKSTR